MIRHLFHGSPSIIEKPRFGYGKPYNDYGLGFYCTDSLEMAKEWGVSQERNGYANCYELECDGLKILDLNGEVPSAFFTGSLFSWRTGSLMCPPVWPWRQRSIS